MREKGPSSNAPVVVQQGDAMGPALFSTAAATGAYEGSGGIRVAGSRSLLVSRRHHITNAVYTVRVITRGTAAVGPFLERELTATTWASQKTDNVS